MEVSSNVVPDAGSVSVTVIVSGKQAPLVSMTTISSPTATVPEAISLPPEETVRSTDPGSVPAPV